jgi:hypothetical protein
VSEPQPSEPAPGGDSPTARDVQYKGAPLDSERGPGLGCFWSQVVVLLILLVLTPLSVAWEWPTWISAALLVLVLVLLLFAGQTVIFLLRLVAADRRAAGRRRPLASATPTVGEIEDSGDEPDSAPDPAAHPAPDPAAGETVPTGAPHDPDAAPSAPDAPSGDGADGVRE